MSFHRITEFTKTRLIHNSYFSYQRCVVQLCIAEQTEYD